MDQAKLLSFLIEVLEAQRLPYGIAGSHASMAYGDSRLTNDIDVLVGLTTGTLSDFCRAFPFPEYYVSEEGARVAATKGGEFNIVHPESGLKIDIFVPKDDFDRVELDRVVRRPAFIGRETFFVTPEDVIIKKMIYYEEGGSEKHLRDITSVLKIQGTRVDRAYIANWVSRLGLTEIWDAILKRLSQ